MFIRLQHEMSFVNKTSECTFWLEFRILVYILVKTLSEKCNGVTYKLRQVQVKLIKMLHVLKSGFVFKAYIFAIYLNVKIPILQTGEKNNNYE